MTHYSLLPKPQITMAPSKRNNAKKPANRASESNPAKKRPTGKSSLITDRAVYFWRETDPDYGFLSQWYYCPFTDPDDESIVYFTAEQ